LNLIKILEHDINSLDKELNLNDIKTKYKDVFQGLGCMENEYDIKIDKTVKPVVRAPRRLPFTIRDKVKQKLDNMCTNRILLPVSTPTEWVSSLVVVAKPDKLRICIDPKDLNNAIYRPHYPMPCIEELAPDLCGAKIFSVLDAKNGFW